MEKILWIMCAPIRAFNKNEVVQGMVVGAMIGVGVTIVIFDKLL